MTTETFGRFSDRYGEYIVTFYEKGNRKFYLKFKNLIIDYVYDYLSINVQSDNAKEFLYEFLFSSVITSYSYWYKNQQIMSLESLTKLINGMILNGSKIILNYIK